MTTQPEALRLAEEIEKAMRPEASLSLSDWARAAAELRRLSAIEDEWARMSQDNGKAEREIARLHEAHDWQYKMAGDRLRRIEKLEAVNQELLEALLLMVAIHDEPAGFVGKYGRALDEAINKQQQKIDARLLKARAAIAKAEGKS